MSEFPQCNMRDCWYSKNQDKLDKYKKSTIYIHNGDVCDVKYNLEDYVGPTTIMLCDADKPKTVGRCGLCNKKMMDDWIFENNQYICSICIDEDDILEELNYPAETLYHYKKERPSAIKSIRKAILSIYTKKMNGEYKEEDNEEQYNEEYEEQYKEEDNEDNKDNDSK